MSDIIKWLAEKQKTALVVSHRLSTLTALDRILVIDKGAILEDGSHQELLSQGGSYAELWHTQNGDW
jgi:ABC-type multidrug transport system fused ATPase/permease subunit